MPSKTDLNILTLQVEAREKSLALEQKMLEALTLQGKSAKVIGVQQEKINKLAEAANKMKGKQLEIEVSLSSEMEKQATRMKTQAVILGGLTTAIGKLQDLSKRFSDNTRSTADTMGINVNEAKKLNTEILGQLKGSKMYDTTMKDVASTAKELSSAFGGSTTFTAEQAVNLDIASKKLGISNTQAAQFSQFMFASSGASLETSTSLMAGVKSLSKASGVKFDVVMGDIASSGKDMANYFGMSGKEIAIMAVQARKMGFELSDVKSMSEGLLDVEGRIEKQMKFNMLTGRNINLDKATQLSLSGDQEGMMKEIVAQAGNLEDLNQLEIKALNEALGVDILKLKNAGALAAKKEEEGIAAQEIADIEALIRAGQLEEFKAKQTERQEAQTGNEQMTNFETNMLDLAAEQLGNMDKANNLAFILQGIQFAIQGIMAVQAIAAAVKAASERKTAQASVAQLPKLATEAGLRSASAVAALTTNAAATFGIGTVIAMAAAGIAVGTLLTMMATSPSVPAAKPTGDLGIDPNGGPIVMSPREGGLFQGTKNDGVSMSPSHGTSGGGGGGMNIQPLLRKMDQLIAAVSKQRQLSIDGYSLNEAIHLEKTPAGL